MDIKYRCRVVLIILTVLLFASSLFAEEALGVVEVVNSGDTSKDLSQELPAVEVKDVVIKDENGKKDNVSERTQIEQNQSKNRQSEKQSLERKPLERQRLEKERLEKERLEKERLEKERLEKERLEKERLEKERLEKERLEKERLEKERLERQRWRRLREAEEARLKQEKLRHEEEAKKRHMRSFLYGLLIIGILFLSLVFLLKGGGMKNMSLGQKMALGFGVVLVLLILVGGISYFGIAKLVNNLNYTIKMNNLYSNLMQQEIDHWNWLNQVDELLTNDDVTELHVQTDNRQSEFGKWLYGEGRKEAEKEIPELIPILKEIEGHHRAVYASAIEIEKYFKPADEELPSVLAQKRTDHLIWADKIRDCFLNKCEKLDVETDPTKCALGKWLQTEQAKKAYETGSLEFRKLWDEMLKVHDQLHKSALEIEKHIAFKELAEAQEQQEEIIQLWEKTAQEFFSVLEGAMEDVIDPAKERAEKNQNIAALAKWSGIDMNMNEEVIEPFWEVRIDGQKMKENYSVEIWKKYEEDYRKFKDGINDWLALVSKEPSMRDVSRKIRDYLVEFDDISDKFHKALLEEVEARVSIQKARDVFLNETLPLLQKTVGILDKLREEAEQRLVGMDKASDIFTGKTKPEMEKTLKLLHEAIDKVGAVVKKSNVLSFSVSNRTKALVIVISLISVVLGVLVAFFIARGIIVVLNKVIEGLITSSDQTSEAAAQVSSSAQQLSQGTTEQASSLEETSSSLDEISSMTKSNADNAGKANQMATEARNSAERGDQAMKDLQHAMVGITESSEKVSKIIKTIEEIAFQTNLLALNAAVEAARAGEHGKGFAVVAEEVRNLAQRAGVAAKDTAQLIEESTNRTKEGSEISKKAGEALGEIIEGSKKVADIVAEIAAASKEQAEGIAQITNAVSQMDQVTQQNAATAEESAAAAEELSSQAEKLKEMIVELQRVVGGSTSNFHRSNRSSLKKKANSSNVGGTNVSSSMAGSQQKTGGTASSGSTTKAEDIIPFDDEDSQDFGDF